MMQDIGNIVRATKFWNTNPPKANWVDQLAEGVVVGVEQVLDRASVALELNVPFDVAMN